MNAQQSYFDGRTFSPVDDGQRHVFWSRVAISGPDDCWEWLAHRTKTGYGRLRFEGRRIMAHRLADLITHGTPLPVGMEIMHTCDNPPSVNPRHLRRATHQDNMSDRANKGRSAKGERIGAAKLSEGDVRAIVALCRAGIEATAIASKFSISSAHVKRLDRGMYWKHLEIAR